DHNTERALPGKRGAGRSLDTGMRPAVGTGAIRKERTMKNNMLMLACSFVTLAVACAAPNGSSTGENQGAVGDTSDQAKTLDDAGGCDNSGSHPRCVDKDGKIVRFYIGGFLFADTPILAVIAEDEATQHETAIYWVNGDEYPANPPMIVAFRN